ncbi:30S ribosome-binding factor RbfA [Methylobacterium sp. JK268]
MRKPNDTAGPSQRQQRVAELVRHAIAEVLGRGDIQDPVLTRHVITVPEVRMSPDLKHATAFVMPLGGQDEAPVLEALERNRKVLRQEVARRVNLKFAPELRFRRDETFDEAARIDRLLRSDKVQRDLEPERDVEPEAGTDH